MLKCVNTDRPLIRANKAVVHSTQAFMVPNPASVVTLLAPGCIQLWLRCAAECLVSMNLRFVGMDEHLVGAYQVHL